MSRSCYLYAAAAGLLAALLVFADTGLHPRANSAEYQAHKDTKDATIAATVVTAEQVARIFSADVGKKYTVVEVAVYPEPGRAVDLHMLDFALRAGPENKSYPATPEEVASIWREKRPAMPGPGVNVVAEAGVAYGRSTNPSTGRTEHGWGTYTGASVDNRPQPSPPPSSGPDPYALEARMTKLALPEGQAAAAIAGYLYFPSVKKKKGEALRLEYFQDPGPVELTFPAR